MDVSLILYRLWHPWQGNSQLSIFNLKKSMVIWYKKSAIIDHIQDPLISQKMSSVFRILWTWINLNIDNDVMCSKVHQSDSSKQSEYISRLNDLKLDYTKLVTISLSLVRTLGKKLVNKNGLIIVITIISFLTQSFVV